jgi:hypothetical protein
MCGLSATEKTNMQLNTQKIVILICGTAAAFLVASALAVTGSQPASATPAFAQQTGKACGYCHVNPAGGGKLKPAGEKFKANGNKL